MFGIFSECNSPIKQANSPEIALQVVEYDVLNVGGGELMSKFIVVVEEGKVRLWRIVKVSHRDDLSELQVTLFEDINIFCKFLSIFILIFVFQIDIPVGIHVVKDSANFSKTRQDFGH